MATIPDLLEIIVKGKKVIVTTRADIDVIRIENINMDAEQAAALARLINLLDGEQELKVEITEYIP